MKKKTTALVLMLALMMALVPATGLAAGWQYSQDGSLGVAIYLPNDGQTIYTDEGFSFEFDLKAPENKTTYYQVAFFGVGQDGAPDYDNEVKNFEVNNARKSNDRYVITLNVADVAPGNYYLTFVLSDTEYTQIALDERRVTVAKREGGWAQYGSKWSYKINNSWVTNKWELIGGKWYRFDSQGYMLTGWQQLGSSWYYLGTDGAMRIGWNVVGGKWYCFRNDGAMYANAWLKDGNEWYMLSNSGAMLTGWQQDGSNWHYLDPSSGKMQTGWQAIGGKWYYLNANGVMVTGKVTIGGASYTFNNSGVWVG